MKILKEETRLGTSTINNFLDQMGIKSRKTCDFYRFVGYSLRQNNFDSSDEDDPLDNGI